MFTLGDVADILDGALDTGISIIDTLSKLSDIADEGTINRNKCYERLQINSDHDIDQKMHTDHQNDKNKDHNVDQRTHSDQNDEDIDQGTNQRKHSDQIGLMDPYIDQEKHSKVDNSYIGHNTDNRQHSDDIDRSIYQRKDSDQNNNDIKTADYIANCPTTVVNSDAFNDIGLNNKELINPYEEVPWETKLRCLDSTVVGAVSDKDQPLSLSNTVKLDVIEPKNVDTEAAVVTRRNRQSKPTRATGNRPSTFVLQESPVKTIDQATAQGIPIIEALGDLCNVADDFLKDYRVTDQSGGGVGEHDSSLNSNAPLTPSTPEEFDLLISAKVSEILSSFEKLDTTVDLLKKKALRDNFSNLKNKDNKELHDLLPQEYRGLLTGLDGNNQKVNSSRIEEIDPSHISTSLNGNNTTSNHTQKHSNSSNIAGVNNPETVDQDRTVPPSPETTSFNNDTTDLVDSENNLGVANPNVTIEKRLVTEKPPVNLRIDIPERPKQQVRPGTYTLSTVLDNVPLTQIEIDIEHDMEKRNTVSPLSPPGCFFKPSNPTGEMKMLNKHLLTSSKRLPDLQVFPIDVDCEPLADESKNNVDTGFRLKRERPGTYVLSSSSSSGSQDSPRKTSLDVFKNRAGTYTKDSPRKTSLDVFKNRAGTYTKDSPSSQPNLDRNDRAGTYTKDSPNSQPYIERNDRTGTYTKDSLSSQPNLDRNDRAGTYTKDSPSSQPNFDRNDRAGTYTKHSPSSHPNLDRNDRAGTYTKNSQSSQPYIDRNDRAGTYTKHSLSSQPNLDRNDRAGTYTKDSPSSHPNLDRNDRAGTYTKNSQSSQPNLDRNDRAGTYTKSPKSHIDAFERKNRAGTYTKNERTSETYLEKDIGPGDIESRFSLRPTKLFLDRNNRTGTYTKTKIRNLQDDDTESGSSLASSDIDSEKISRPRTFVLVSDAISPSSENHENSFDRSKRFGTYTKESRSSSTSNDDETEKTSRPRTFVLNNTKGSSSSSEENHERSFHRNKRIGTNNEESGSSISPNEKHSDRKNRPGTYVLANTTGNTSSETSTSGNSSPIKSQLKPISPSTSSPEINSVNTISRSPVTDSYGMRLSSDSEDVILKQSEAKHKSLENSPVKAKENLREKRSSSFSEEVPVVMSPEPLLNKSHSMSDILSATAATEDAFGPPRVIGDVRLAASQPNLTSMMKNARKISIGKTTFGKLSLLKKAMSASLTKLTQLHAVHREISLSTDTLTGSGSEENNDGGGSGGEDIDKTLTSAKSDVSSTLLSSVYSLTEETSSPPLLSCSTSVHSLTKEVSSSPLQSPFSFSTTAIKYSFDLEKDRDRCTKTFSHDEIISNARDDTAQYDDVTGDYVIDDVTDNPEEHFIDNGVIGDDVLTISNDVTTDDVTTKSEVETSTVVRREKKGRSNVGEQHSSTYVLNVNNKEQCGGVNTVDKDTSDNNVEIPIYDDLVHVGIDDGGDNYVLRNRSDSGKTSIRRQTIVDKNKKPFSYSRKSFTDNRSQQSEKTPENSPNQMRKSGTGLYSTKTIFYKSPDSSPNGSRTLKLSSGSYSTDKPADNSPTRTRKSSTGSHLKDKSADSSPNRTRRSVTGLYSPKNTAVHTNYLKKKSKDLKLNKKALQEDVPLSSRLAALRMQLEEKRRQFEEEKKSKLKEWNEERAQALQNAFFVSFDEKENKDPTTEQNQNIHLDVRSSQSTVSKSLSPREYIRQKQLEKAYAPDRSASQKPTWFVDFDGEENKEGMETTEENGGTNEISNVDPREIDRNNSNAPISITDNNTSELRTQSIVDHPTEQPQLNIRSSHKYSEDTTPPETTAPISVTSHRAEAETGVTLNSYTAVNEVACSKEASMMESSSHQAISVVDNLPNEFEYNTEHIQEDINSLKENPEEAEEKVEDVKTSGDRPVPFTEEKLELIQQHNASTTSDASIINQLSNNFAAMMTSVDLAQQPTEEAAPVAPEKLAEQASPSKILTTEQARLNNNLTTEHASQSSILAAELASQSDNLTTEQVIPSNILRTEQASPSNNLTTEQAIPNNILTIEQPSPSNILTTEQASPTQAATWAFTFGDEAAESPGMTPDQMKKRDRFIKNRQKKIEEKRAKREAELEKKRLKEEEEEHEERTKKEEEHLLKRSQSDQSFVSHRLSQQQQQQHHNNANDQNNHLYQSRPTTTTLQQRQQMTSSGVARTTSPTINNDKRKPTTDAIRRVNSASPNLFAGVQQQLSSEMSEEKRFTEYNGPSAYQKPSGKSNRKIIQNAISHCCLSGAVNRDAKEKCLQAIEASESHHFLVLFRDPMKFRGVYAYCPEAELVTKVYGVGPKTVTSKMTDKFFRYNSGGKSFNSLLMKNISIQCDGMAIKKELWEKKQQTPSSTSKTRTNIRTKISR